MHIDVILAAPLPRPSPPSTVEPGKGSSRRVRNGRIAAFSGSSRAPVSHGLLVQVTAPPGMRNDT